MQSKETTNDKSPTIDISYFENTLTYLNNWNEDIPDRLLSGLTAEPYKVRKNRFAGVVSITDHLYHLLQSTNSDQYEIIKKIHDHELPYFINEEFKDRLTTREDIQKGNDIIHKLFNILNTIK